MKTKNHILQCLAKLKPTIAARYNIEKIALFGSFARDDFGPNSDVDLLVEFKISPGMEIVDLVLELETAVGRKVDLVSRRAVKPHYLKVIEPELIYV